MKITKWITTSIAMLALSPVYAGTLILDSTIPLSDTLAAASSNFHPQGLGYDTGTGELLFIQQGSHPIYSTDLSGNITGSRTIGFNHATSVAGDADGYYFSDYTANTNGLDLYSIDKLPADPAVAISTEIAAYGGYPIDVRGGMIYRTENSTNYDWSNLDQIRISSLSSVDSFSTVDLATGNGIGDIAVDAACNAAWVIDYSDSASLRQFDLATGTELESVALNLDGLTAGITYADNKLYYYDWNSGTGSTLSVYSMLDFPCNNLSLETESVPGLSVWGLAIAVLLLGGIGFTRARRINHS